MKEEITFDQFLEIEKKLDIRIGTIITVERIPKSNKLLKLRVSFGDGLRTIVTNIGDRFTDPEITLKDVQMPFILNLKPVSMMGVISEGMILPPIKDDRIQIDNILDG